MAVVIVNPNGMQFNDWADQMVGLNSSLGIAGSASFMKSWQDWAIQFIQLNEVKDKSPPSPYKYSEWQNWVQDLAQSVPYSV